MSYDWTSKAGTTISLPPLDSLTAGTIRRHRQKSDLDFMFSLLEEVMDADSLAALDDLTLTEAEQLFQDWQTNAKVSVPQS
jgi:hypothetical protein